MRRRGVAYGYLLSFVPWKRDHLYLQKGGSLEHGHASRRGSIHHRNRVRQNNYNLAHREDDPLIKSLARQGIAYVPFFPLGGFMPLQSSTLSAMAERLGSKPMQVALAWLLHRSPNILLIPGTSSVAHLRENLATAQLELSPETLTELDAIAAEAEAAKH